MSTSDSSRRHPRADHHLVRPRWVWGGLVVALVGLGVLGVGIALLSLPVSIAGAVLLLTGAICSAVGGVMYDAVAHLAAGRELDQVAHGGVHEGVAPGEMTHEPRAHTDASRASTSAEVAPMARPSTPDRRPTIAGLILLGVAVFLVLSQPWFIAHSATGRASAFRDVGLAVIVGLAGLRIATGLRTHPIAIGLAVLGGVGLVLGGVLAQHDRTSLATVEVICGAVAILAAMAGIGQRGPKGT